MVFDLVTRDREKSSVAADGRSHSFPWPTQCYSFSSPSAASLFSSTLYNNDVNPQTHQTSDHIASKAISYKIKTHRVEITLVSTQPFAILFNLSFNSLQYSSMILNRVSKAKAFPRIFLLRQGYPCCQRKKSSVLL